MYRCIIFREMSQSHKTKERLEITMTDVDSGGLSYFLSAIYPPNTIHKGKGAHNIHTQIDNLNVLDEIHAHTGYTHTTHPPTPTHPHTYIYIYICVYVCVYVYIHKYIDTRATMSLSTCC